MTHIPQIRSINALCWRCETVFGYVAENGAITCPGCRAGQLLPVILIGKDEYHCTDCKTTFGAATAQDARCQECRKTWQKPAET